MKKTKVIFSMKLAGKLMRMGNELLDRQPNMRDPKYDVFIFENTKKLQENMDIAIEEL